MGTGVTATVKYSLRQKGNQNVRSVNAVVGETNDGYLNDIRGMHVKEEDVWQAIENAKSGKVEEGTVGAGTGTRAFGYKGGIGTSSRQVSMGEGNNYTVGVLVQSNFGWILTINGVPFSREMRQPDRLPKDDGSCMIVIATDAPLSVRNLKRLAKRSFTGMARTRSVMSNSSGDYAIAFSTAYRIPNDSQGKPFAVPDLIANSDMNPFFHAVEEATQEAIYNSMFMATTVTGYKGRTVEAIPLDEVIKISKKYNMLNLHNKLLWNPYEGN